MHDSIFEYIERHMLEGTWINLRDAKRRMNLKRHGITDPEVKNVLETMRDSGLMDIETTSISRRKRMRVRVQPWHQQRHVDRGSINMGCVFCRKDVQIHADWCQAAEVRDL
jgi:hypothetical protein